MDTLVKLARAAAIAVVKKTALPAVPGMNAPLLTRQRACFVYIVQWPGRQLRAWYGTALPRERTLAEEIIRNARDAVFHGATRAIRRPDLASLRYTVVVLEPLQRISHEAQLDPGRFGLYVISDRGRTALLMPRHPGIITARDQIATAMREAGLQPRQETVTMYRFPVTFYEDR